MAFIGPAHIDLLPWNNVKDATGGWSRVQGSTLLTGGRLATASGVGNYASWDVPLMAGTWTITAIYTSASGAGIITASLGGVDLSPTVDSYSVSSTPNVVAQWTGVSVASGGVKEFKIRSDSKNASSASNIMYPQLITFTNTDAPTQSFSCAGPSRFDIIPYGYRNQGAGGVYSRLQNSAALSGGAAYWSPSNSANEMGWYVPLTAGTWAIDIIHVKASDSAILNVTFDGASIGTQDLYAAGTSYNNVYSVTGISVPTSKFVLVKLGVPTKNASASGFTGYFQHIALRKTA